MRVNHAEPDYVFHYTGVVDDTMTPEPDDASLGYNQRGKVKVHMEIADPLKSIPKLKAGDALTFAHSRFPGDAVVTAVPEVGRKVSDAQQTTDECCNGVSIDCELAHTQLSVCNTLSVCTADSAVAAYHSVLCVLLVGSGIPFEC